MSDLDKMQILKDCAEVGKLPISGGRYIVVSTASRLKDGSGCGVYLDLEDKNGNDIPLAAMIDHLKEDGDPCIHLFAAYDFESDELETARKWTKEDIEEVENPKPEQEEKPWSVTFTATIGVNNASNREEAIELAKKSLTRLDMDGVDLLCEVDQVEEN